MKNFIVFLLLIIGSILLMVMLAPSEVESTFRKGKKQLEHQGYSQIRSTGYSWMCCSEEDFFSIGFKAQDKEGNNIEGCFCSGFTKGITIRFL